MRRRGCPEVQGVSAVGEGLECQSDLDRLLADVLQAGGAPEICEFAWRASRREFRPMGRWWRRHPGTSVAFAFRRRSPIRPRR